MRKAFFKALQVGFCIVLFVQNACANGAAPERIVWDKKPIPVHVKRGGERIIHFPGDIRYWLPDSIKNRVTALAANGVLYLQANDNFPRTRIRVQEITSQHVYLLDVTANDEPSVSEELVVIDPRQLSNLSKSEQEGSAGEDWKVRLTRYASQQLYAPERILTGDPAIKRIALNTQDPVSLIRGGEFTTTPIATWRGGGYYLTAVKVVNQTPQTIPIRFDEGEDNRVLTLARQLRGVWLTVTPQHTFLGPHGSIEDTTVLYIASTRPFGESFDFKAEVDDG